VRRRLAGKVGKQKTTIQREWISDGAKQVEGRFETDIARSWSRGRDESEGAYRHGRGRERRDTSSATVRPSIPAKTAVSFSAQWSLTEVQLGPGATEVDKVLALLGLRGLVGRKVVRPIGDWRRSDSSALPRPIPTITSLASSLPSFPLTTLPAPIHTPHRCSLPVVSRARTHLHGNLLLPDVGCAWVVSIDSSELAGRACDIHCGVAVLTVDEPVDHDEDV
jgi:hypothetical protein